MSLSNDSSHPGRDQEAAARLLDLIFFRVPDKVAEMLIATEAMIDDCRHNDGRATLWPMSVHGDIAVAVGPEGRSLTLQVEETDDAIVFRADEVSEDVQPLCCWAGTLRSSIREEVLSPPMFLPEHWLADASERELAHALGSGSKQAIGSDEVALPEIGLGFVIASAEADGGRTTNLQVFGRPDFAGHAVAEIQFLGDDDQRIDVEPAVRPQLIELRANDGRPASRPAERVTLALGETGVVRGECLWNVPAKLRGVRRCRIALRPVEPREALRLARRPSPIPFLPSDDERGYFARRRKSDLALPDQGDRTEYGFLLSVADRKAVRERLFQLASQTVEQHGGGQAVSELADQLGGATISLEAALERGADDLVAMDAEEESLLAYLYTMGHYAALDLLRAGRRGPVKYEGDLSATFNIDDRATSTGVDDSRPEGYVRELSELLCEIGSEGFRDLREALLAAYRKWELRQSHATSRHRLLFSMLLDGESIDTIAKVLGYSGKKSAQKAKDRLLEGLRLFFADLE